MGHSRMDTSGLLLGAFSCCRIHRLRDPDGPEIGIPQDAAAGGFSAVRPVWRGGAGDGGFRGC